MRALLLCAVVLCGCEQASKQSHLQPLRSAVKYVGYNERINRVELDTLLGVDPIHTEWCAAFINAVLEESNYASLNTIGHPHPLTARGFLSYGTSITKDEVQAGDIVVFPRGNQPWQGHVGLFLRKEISGSQTYYYILGGNQSGKVSVVLYNETKVLSIRRPILEKNT